MNKVCFIVCWFGELPKYFGAWAKTCAYNTKYDFLLFSDHHPDVVLPENIKYNKFDKDLFVERVKKRLIKKPSIKKAYRLCDFRPMYGIIFSEELKEYEYWGYCDIDVVFGSIEKFCPIDEIKKYDAVFNNGHFTLIRNTDCMNRLYMQKGSLFNYKTVMTHDATFAFDETTGIQRIAKKNNINAKFGIEYVETESKYRQLRSRMEITNPDKQGFYWENGHLYRVKAKGTDVYYKELAYVHLQKRKIDIKEREVIESNSFWITPSGYEVKKCEGFPSISDIEKYNPFEGKSQLKLQEKQYKKKKISEILGRTPYQIYVRVIQGIFGINAEDGRREETPWAKC